MSTYLVSPYRGKPISDFAERCSGREAWAAARKLKRSKRRALIGAVMGRKVKGWPGSTTHMVQDWIDLDLPPRLFDHIELFRDPRKRQYTLTTQPYGATVEAINELKSKLAPLGLVAEQSWDGWHNPASCPLIVIRKA